MCVVSRSIDPVESIASIGDQLARFTIGSLDDDTVGRFLFFLFLFLFFFLSFCREISVGGQRYWKETRRTVSLRFAVSGPRRATRPEDCDVTLHYVGFSGPIVFSSSRFRSSNGTVNAHETKPSNAQLLSHNRSRLCTRLTFLSMNRFLLAKKYQ